MIKKLSGTFLTAVGITAIIGCASVPAHSATLQCNSPFNAAASFADKEPLARAQHLLNRITFGPRPGDVDAVLMMGIDRYIEQQLNPANIPQSAILEQALADSSLAPIRMSIEQLTLLRRQETLARNKAAIAGLQPVPLTNISNIMARAKVLRAVLSQRQLEEVMVDFWYNHFNIHNSPETISRTPSYERDAIRPYVLGKFRDLVMATAKHPAMLRYLDNELNVKDAINENYARELMELHTLGIRRNLFNPDSTSVYTQQDVTTLAYLLTGWGVNKSGDPGTDGTRFVFSPERHDNRTQIFLGQTIPSGGAEQVERAIDILTRRASTARHIAYKLAVAFVSDSPPRTLVSALTTKFRETDGDIRAVMRTLLKSPEFWDPAVRGISGKKFKDPFRYTVSLARSLGAVPSQGGRGLVGDIQNLGQNPYHWLTPDGEPIDGQSWLNADSLLKRVAYSLKGFALQMRTVTGDRSALMLGALCPNTVSANTLGIIFATDNTALRAQLLAASPEFLYH